LAGLCEYNTFNYITFYPSCCSFALTWPSSSTWGTYNFISLTINTEYVSLLKSAFNQYHLLFLTKMEDEIDALSTQLSQFRLGFGTRANRPSIFTVKQPERLLKSSWKSKPADEHKLSYLSLPGEIRNQIMRYALVPGAIHLPAPTLYRAGQSGEGPLSELKLRPPKPSAPPLPVSNNRKRRRSSASNSPQPDPDLRGHFYPPKPIKPTLDSLKIASSWYNGRRKPFWPLLATCKQTYSEGCWFLYGCNSLHLASGDLRNSLSHLRKVSRSNIGLTRQIFLHLSLADLDSDVLSYTKYEYALCRFLAPTAWRRHSQRRHIVQTLRNIWASKMAYIRGFQNLDYLAICLNFPDLAENRKAGLPQGTICDTIIIRGCDVAKSLLNIAPRNTLPLLDDQGRIDYSDDGYYSDWNSEMKYWFGMALRRCEVLLKGNLAEGDLDTLDPWTQGLFDCPRDKEDLVGGWVLRVLGYSCWPPVLNV